MTDTARVPAGWYPDPLGLPQLRWWDNHSWTEHVSDSEMPLIVQETITTQARLAWADDDFRDRDARDRDDASTGSWGASAAGSTVATRLRTARPPLQLERAAEPDADTSRAPHHRPAAASASGSASDSASDSAVADASASDLSAADFSVAGLLAADLAVAAPSFTVAEVEDLLPAAQPTVPDSAPLELSELAAAVIAARDATVPELVDITLADGTVIRLDPVDNLVWGGPEGVEPTSILAGAVARRRPRHEAPMPTQAGRDAEPLLWAIGTRSPLLPLERAGLDAASRVKLHRWPNLTALEHTPEQLAMTAMLAHAHLTAAELAALSRAAPVEAKALLIAFRVMNLLVRVDDAPAAPAAAVVAVEADAPVSTGLFGRLRRALGR